MAGPHPPVALRLSAAEVTRLDRIARAKGYTRSELLRLIIRRGLPYADDFAPKDFGPAVQPGGPAQRAERAPPAA